MIGVEYTGAKCIFKYFDYPLRLPCIGYIQTVLNQEMGGGSDLRYWIKLNLMFKFYACGAPLVSC